MLLLCALLNRALKRYTNFQLVILSRETVQLVFFYKSVIFNQFEAETNTT